MFRGLSLFLLCALATAENRRAPVLIELFTSEGCSSCPPADRLLQQLDGQAIVLSEHVDYWDHLGWRDPFSSHAFTERQEIYARLLHAESYTPQMVIDGSVAFVGNDSPRAAQEIEKAGKRAKIESRLQRTNGGLHVEIDEVPGKADVMLALADDADASQVAAGENKGRKLQHVAVVRSLKKIGAVKAGTPFRGDFALPANSAAQRIVVFLQESGQSRVDGAAMLAPSTTPTRKPESPRP